MLIPIYNISDKVIYGFAATIFSYFKSLPFISDFLTLSLVMFKQWFFLIYYSITTSYHEPMPKYWIRQNLRICYIFNTRLTLLSPVQKSKQLKTVINIVFINFLRHVVDMFTFKNRYSFKFLDGRYCMLLIKDKIYGDKGSDIRYWIYLLNKLELYWKFEWKLYELTMLKFFFTKQIYCFNNWIIYQNLFLTYYIHRHLLTLYVKWQVSHVMSPHSPLLQLNDR